MCCPTIVGVCVWGGGLVHWNQEPISGSAVNSRGEGHSDEDSAQGVAFSVHGDGGTNLQVTE